MAWAVVVLGYVLGSFPTAYIAGRLVREVDIRQIGDRNMGAQNAFRQLGAGAGLLVVAVDAAKGALAVTIARAAGLPQAFVFLAGAAAVVGHNWPVFLGFRGGRGEATTLGIFYTLLTMPMLIVTGPAMLVLALKRNVELASAVAFVPLPLVCWWLGVPGTLIAYNLALLLLVAFTHLLRTRILAVRRA